MPIEEKIGNFCEFYSLLQKMKRIYDTIAFKFDSLTNTSLDWIAFVDN